MGMDLKVKTFRHEPEYFEAGGHPIAKAVKEAAADIAAHAPVILNESGKLEAATKENKASLYGLLPEAAENGKEAVVYLTGEFFADALVLPESTTAKDFEVELRKLGIFLK